VERGEEKKGGEGRNHDSGKREKKWFVSFLSLSKKGKKKRPWL